jgi:arginase
MKRTVRIIGAPTDYGTNRRGVDMGPSAIRYAGLVDQLDASNRQSRDVGDLFVARTAAEDERMTDPNARHLDETREVCERVSAEVGDAVDDGEIPLLLGGDHSVAIGTVNGAARDSALGAVWFDAHGDFNTPSTTPSGNVHGMPLAALLGHGEFESMEWARAEGLSEENVALVGVRTLDENEREHLRESDITVFTMSDIDTRGLTDVVQEALDIATDGVDGFHVSLDMDWLDPQIAPGVGTPVRGGVTYREAHAAMEQVAARDGEGSTLRSIEVVEVNPILDEQNETADLATELATSALGKRIY